MNRQGANNAIDRKTKHKGKEAAGANRQADSANVLTFACQTGSYRGCTFLEFLTSWRYKL